MLNEKERAALEGALKLTEYCSQVDDCRKCLFLNDWGGCSFIGNFPDYWESWLKEILQKNREE